MNEEIRNILAEAGTKTSKIRNFFCSALLHREIDRARYSWKSWIRVECI